MRGANGMEECSIAEDFGGEGREDGRKEGFSFFALRDGQGNYEWDAME